MRENAGRSLATLKPALAVMVAIAFVLASTACSGNDSGPGRPSGGTGGTSAGGGGGAGAAGGTGGYAGTGGVVGNYWDTPHWAKCLEFVRAVCERIVVCEPAVAAWKYGDSDQVNRCVATERKAQCFGVAQPHQSHDALAWLDCVTAEAPKMNCADASFFWPSAICGPYPNGTQPVGGACEDDVQCASRACSSGIKNGCHRCQAPIVTGGTCDHGDVCAGGTRCVANVCVKALPEGAPCTALNACQQGLICRGAGVCRKYSKLGDPCNPNEKQPCAPYLSSLGPYWSGVECESGICTWKPAAPFKRAIGEVCDDVTIIDVCGKEYSAGDARCDKNSGKCVATVGEGEACDDAHPCDWGNGLAACFQGKCIVSSLSNPSCYNK